jgi:hypothetical protein
MCAAAALASAVIIARPWSFICFATSRHTGQGKRHHDAVRLQRIGVECEVDGAILRQRDQCAQRDLLLVRIGGLVQQQVDELCEVAGEDERVFHDSVSN